MWKLCEATSGLTRHFNACKNYYYPKPLHKPLQRKPQNKEDAMGGSWEDESDLLGETVTTANRNGTPITLTENTPLKRLFASKSLPALREKWFSSNKFPANTSISDKKYKHPRSKHKSSFYLFNNQLDYGLAHYFPKPETTKGNMNKFITNPLMAPLIKKLSYKNSEK